MANAPVTIGSMCSGIGGLDLGVERATGATVAWHGEFDSAPSKVLANHYPHIPNLQDLRSVDWSKVQPVDIFTAGYPCQPFSHAGARRGSDDPRHLWPVINDAICALRPRYVLLENVRGHLSLGFGDVLGDLASEGYDARWEVFRASDVGAPHRRERVFILAWDASAHDPHSMAWPSAITRDGGPEPLDESPAIERTIGSDCVDSATNSDDPGCCEQRGSVADEEKQPATQCSCKTPWGEYEPAIRRWESIHGPAPVPALDGKLNPRFVEWIMGYESGWCTNHLTRREALKALGNAVVPQVAELAWIMLTDEARWTQ